MSEPFYLGQGHFSFEPDPDQKAKAAEFAAAYNKAIKKTVSFTVALQEFDFWAWVILTYPRRYG